MTSRIAIVDDEPITRLDIKEFLTDAGYSVVGEAGDGFDGVELCRREKPDLVILDIKMPLLDGMQAARTIRREVPGCAILLLTAYSSQEYISKGVDLTVEGYLVKPVKESSLVPMIEIAIAKMKETKRLKEEKNQLEIKLEERKLIDRAKGLLMKQYDLDEPGAYKQLRSLSMNKRCNLAEIAKILLGADNG
ncbi:MAG: response regulator [Spirochaetaceae bacterium 4572_59]|nr:MAG: response regulator [Spirochaetaceae bacterium 4572_59]